MHQPHFSYQCWYCFEILLPNLVSQISATNVGFAHDWLGLSHPSQDQMAAILQTTFSNAFSSMKSFVFQFEFHWSFFPKGPIDNKPALVQVMADPVHQCTYAALEGDELTHWGQATHICPSKLTIIGSDNGMSPGRRQAIIWTNAGILLIGLLGTNFSETLIEIHIFSFKKMRLKVSSAKWRPFCLGLNRLRQLCCLSFTPIACQCTSILPISFCRSWWH